MERRSSKLFNQGPRPTVYWKRPPKNIEELKARLRLIAQISAVIRG